MASKFYGSLVLQPRDAVGFEARVHKVKMLSARVAAVELPTEVPRDRTVVSVMLAEQELLTRALVAMASSRFMFLATRA
ncbi:Histone acetyltransferase [Psidium guajava]|nr:Histone acetyltransferase [Psidium guajava]